MVKTCHDFENLSKKLSGFHPKLLGFDVFGKKFKGNLQAQPVRSLHFTIVGQKFDILYLILFWHAEHLDNQTTIITKTGSHRPTTPPLSSDLEIKEKKIFV